MPTAEELRELGNHKNIIDKFLEMAVFEVKNIAWVGGTSAMVDAPLTIKTEVARFHLLKTFPDCKITRNLFSPHFKIDWS